MVFCGPNAKFDVEGWKAVDNVYDAHVALVPDIGLINSRCQKMNVDGQAVLVFAHEVVAAIFLGQRIGTVASLQTPKPDRHRSDHSAMYCPLWQVVPKLAIHLTDRFEIRHGSIVACIRRAVALTQHWVILDNAEHRAWSKNGFKTDKMVIRCNDLCDWHQFVVTHHQVNRLLGSNGIFRLKA